MIIPPLPTPNGNAPACGASKMRRNFTYIFFISAVGSLVYYLLNVQESAAQSSQRRSGQRSTFKAEDIPGSFRRVSPSCTIWPDWRPTIPSSVPPNESQLRKSRLGTAEVFGGPLREGCVPVEARLGPFGRSAIRSSREHPDWSSLRWGELQSRCAAAYYPIDDAHRSFRKLERASRRLDSELKASTQNARQTGRTAVVLRAWDSYEYSDNQMAWIRMMIAELSLDTGGAYQLFILVDVKDTSLDLLDDRTYADVLERSVPEELRDISLLWNEELVRDWFPKVGNYQAKDQMYQALQIFSITYPQFDFVWQLEMDARFTGNVARSLENAALWAQKQPRRNLWERNAQFYIPGLWNHDYSKFAEHVDAEFGSDQGVWGPHRYAYFYLRPQGPAVPDEDSVNWGVGEPAELITFSPMIDPIGTEWTYEHTVEGFDAPQSLPRRMAMVSITRTSRRLLRLITAQQRQAGSWVVSESTPETWSLLHGLKAVYVPHLSTFNFDEGEMSPKELDKMVHKGPAWSRAGGNRAGFLWCGNEIGMPEPRWMTSSYFYWAGDAPRMWWEYTNGSCTHPMLLHPVKID